MAPPAERRSTGRPVAHRKLAPVLLTLFLVAACSGGDDDRTAESEGGAASTPTSEDRPDGAPSTAASTPAPPPEEFTGSVEAFYEVPDPLPEGAPGELIRVQPVSDADGRTTMRIMYHSRDARDEDRAVTGILTHPTGTPPADGWPVISTANGTTGLASQCALSRLGNPGPDFGIEAVAVVTDYIGLGPVGETHPYLSRLSEGHSVIDAVRAARNIVEADVGTEWLAFGHSQGGHGALSAHELVDDYAPELELRGTVSVAPAAMFDRTYGGIDEIVSTIVGAMGLYGAASEHPQIDPDDYVSEEVSAAAEVLETGCLGDIIGAFAAIPVESFYEHDPVETEPARSIILANDVGQERAEAPLLLISGTADERVVPERVRDLFDRLCEVGQVTEFVEIEGATHDDEVPRSQERIRDWFSDRLAEAPPTDSCAGPGG